MSSHTIQRHPQGGLSPRLVFVGVVVGIFFFLSSSLSASDVGAPDDTEPRNPALTEPQNGVAALSSDSDRLGVHTSAPFTTVNEFTGKLNIALDPIGVPGMFLQPLYKSPQEKYCDDESGFRLCPMNEAPAGQGLGYGWSSNFGYILARNAIFGNGAAPSSADWERVRFVDTAGNITPFGRDGVFQASPEDGGAGDACLPDGCTPVHADIHFIDSQLRRITRERTFDGTSLEGFSQNSYFLLDPNGQRTEYQAIRRVTQWNNTTAVKFLPVQIRLPNQRTINISYVGGIDPDGTLPDSGLIDRVTDSFGRSLQFHYADGQLERVTLESSQGSKLLRSFRYQSIQVGNQSFWVLHKVITPEGYETEFTTEDIGERVPYVTTMKLPTGGTVRYQYATQSFQHLEVDTSDCRAARDDGCEEYILRSRPFVRLSQMSFGGGRYTFDYHQWTASEERTNPQNEGRIDVTVTEHNGDVQYQRVTSYVNTPIFETYFQTWDQAHVVGRPRERTVTFGNSSYREAWTYTPPLNIGGHAGGDPVQVHALRQHSQLEDGVWLDTNYHYSWFDENGLNGQNFDQNFLQPMAVVRKARHGSHILRKNFEYTHRVVREFDEHTNVIEDLYAINLVTEERETFQRGTVVETVGRTTYAYENAIFPFVTEVRRWRNASESERDTFAYYQNGANRGLLLQETRGDATSPTSYHDFAFGVPTRIDHPEGVDTIRTIHADGSVANETVDGVTTTYRYDGDGRLVLVQQPDTADLITEHSRPGTSTPYMTSYYRLDAPGNNPSEMTFPIVTRTKAGYTIPVIFRQFDEWGRETREGISTLDQKTWYRDTTYTPLGMVSRKTSGLGGHWSYAFDAFGRPAHIYFTWTEANRILQDTTFDYRRTSDGGAVFSQSVTAYDSDDSLERIQETDFLGRTTMAATNGHNTFFRYAPHPQGLETTTLPYGESSLARTTVTTWLGQVLEETHPEISEQVRYEYNSRGLLEKRYQGNTANPTETTRYVHDGLGRVVQRYGRRQSEANESLLSAFTYDHRNRLTEAVQYADNGLSVTYSYKSFDDANRLKGMRITLPQLDGANLGNFDVPYEALPGSRTYELDIEYDEIGRERWFQHPNGAFESYTYDYFSAPRGVFYGFGPNHPEGPAFEHLIDHAQYNPYNGQLLAALWDQGECQSGNCAPALARMAEPVTDEERRRPPLSEDELIDTEAIEAAAEEARDSSLSLFNYWWPDSLGRSASCQLRGSVGYLYQRQFTRYNEWGYIASYTRNDRLFPSATEMRHEYTDRGQLRSFAVGDEAISYQYDTVGNLTSRSSMSFHTGTATLAVVGHSAQYIQGNRFHRDGGYDYDPQGRLANTPNHQVRYNRDGQVSQILANRRIEDRESLGSGAQLFLYDAFGERVVAVREDSETVIYSIRHAGRIITEEEFATDTVGDLTERRQYITLQGKAIYVEKKRFDDGQLTAKEKTHFFRDRLGNPVVTWDGETDEFKTSAYEPYGQPLIEEARHKGAHGFTGHDEDPNGLIYMGARFYDPVAGCFTQPDTARDFNPYLPNSYNLYSYTNQNPANAFDPNGKAAETVWDVINIGIGVASFVDNVREGNWGAAALDAGGVAVDVLAAAVPVLPGGAGATIKAMRYGDDAVAVATTLVTKGDEVVDGATTLATKSEEIAKATDETYEILDGVRRSKAADLTNQKTIKAEIFDKNDRLVRSDDVPLDRLKSPKEKIDLSNGRFQDTMKRTKEGRTPPPIQVTPGNKGTPIKEVGFEFKGVVQ
ncbi:RHS repeat-associated core domain-containing protein [Sulfidibacter corallicola]|uniref:RHS repeat-associated core domain-containing protein n=1 Tax=Sulfidibacter corallicola TaxID=2818388 RepID=A0A8A4TV71_SULCO|nr:RHS repeat-associated core domain-containing protein [Sulfidibacter corallicola]QTD52912.1 RHS repeat-associated core domain-containing protein [Sulfidibacter corallicola]